MLKEKIKTNSADKMHALQPDLTSDPLPDKTFDHIYTAITLYHIPDTDDLLGKFGLLLKSGGTLCMAELDKEDDSFHGQDVDDVHKEFDRNELKFRLKQHGFSNIKFSTAYRMEREIDDGNPKMFPIFLMTARNV